MIRLREIIAFVVSVIVFFIASFYLSQISVFSDPNVEFGAVNGWGVIAAVIVAVLVFIFIVKAWDTYGK